ncbi:MAG: M20/M25/M40 family metallo-hydrolase [Ferruginibacter sp.]
MKYILLLSILFTQRLSAQELNTADNKTISDLKKTIYFLADDKLEGRRTGTAGEKLAYEFIESEFRKTGLLPPGTGQTYLQEFEVKDGREIQKETTLLINGQLTTINTDFFPLSYSADVKSLKFYTAADYAIAYYDAGNVMQENTANPHFDLKENIYTEAKKAGLEGKKIFVVYNSSSVKDDISFDAKDKAERLSIPVIYYTKQTKLPGGINISINIKEKNRFGHNVMGYINNKAENTIILGAHYDHLGYGEDHNSLYVGKPAMIHNGADDNASGIAALIELSKWLKISDLKKYNYAFVAFSGEELGLYGSKYFADHSPIDLKTVNYMLNMDMLGRLNDSTHGLNVGGYGTSPTWSEVIKKEDSFLKIKTDSSGMGPSDQTSFYKKDIPVIYFFTGSHLDYHKPSDDADKINFNGEMAVINYIKNILAATDQKEKLVFTKTRDVSTGKSSFKVSLGIMPDYTFDGNGVRVDAVIDNRPAQKAGLKAGDVLYQLGDHSFTDVQTYMDALNKFNKGDGTKVKLRRGNEEMEMDIVF